MSLRTDRVLSQAWRYARHWQDAATGMDKVRSMVAFHVFAAQFPPLLRQQVYGVYRATLDGDLVEDRRSRGRQA